MNPAPPPDPFAIRETPAEKFQRLHRVALRLYAAQSHHQALAHLEQAQAMLSSPDPGLLLTRGTVLLALGYIEDSLQAYLDALAIQPDDWRIIMNIAGTLVAQGRSREAEPYYLKALKFSPEPNRVVSNLLLSYQYRSDLSRPEFLQAQQRALRYYQHGRASSIPSPTLRENQPLRLGFVSPDFSGHPVGHFFLHLLWHFDNSGFQIFCYSNAPSEDALTGKIREACHGWRVILGIDDHKALETIRADKIHILIDLAGHTAGNRLPLFSLRPAPIQMTWLGYPGSTGAPGIDYRIADSITEPMDEACDSSERVIRLPGGYHCFPVPENAPDIQPPPALRNGHVTFGSFNNVAKISPASIALWREVLSSIPGSRLILKGKAFIDRPTVKRFQEQFGDVSERVEFRPWSPSVESHLHVYNEIDIALDTVPYNGTMTTCEALWMGVPVITMRGERFAARVGASLLTQAGLENLIAKNETVYVETASKLAKSTFLLKKIRNNSRSTLNKSALMDVKKFSSTFINALKTHFTSF